MTEPSCRSGSRAVSWPRHESHEKVSSSTDWEYLERNHLFGRHEMG